MEQKNLISIKQIRQSQLSGFVIPIASGVVTSYVSGVSGYLLSYISGVSGGLQSQIDAIAAGGEGVQSFSFPIASGVDQITITYGSPSSNISVGQVGCSSPTDPFILSMLSSHSSISSVVDLSAPTTSDNYYMNLLVPV